MSWKRWRSGRFFGGRGSLSKVLGIGWIFALNSAFGRWTRVDAQFCSTRRLVGDVLLQEVFFHGGNVVGIVGWWEGAGCEGSCVVFFTFINLTGPVFFTLCWCEIKAWSTFMRERTFLVRQKVNTSQMGHGVQDGNRECLRYADLTDIEIMVDGKYENWSTLWLRKWSKHWWGEMGLCMHKKGTVGTN